MMDFRDNMQKCQDYIHGLEDERKKIQVFQRELPLCFQLVTQAIEACRRQLSGTSTTTECSEQTTSNNGPILEEFIPIIRTTHSDDIIVDDEHECDKPQFDSINLNNLSTNNDNSGKKSDWLKSVQLWNQTLDPPTNQQDDDDEQKKVGVVEVKNNNGGGAFHPFIMKEKNSSSIISNNENSNIRPTTALPAASACSSAEAAEEVDGSGYGSGLGNGHKEEEKNGKSDRKARRCWSPELHRRFLHSLEQLGGAHVATPKQIRELMRVDGLTNDEVKSHLQKYRLHTRRPTSSNANTCTVTPTTTPQPHHQFVVVGGIWVPPHHQEFPVYTPVSTVPPPRPQLKKMLSTSHLRCSERRSPRDGSSSSHAATTTTTTTTVASHGHAF